MPIYEYKCKGCGEGFEMIQGFSDKPPKECSKCGGKLTKLVSECAFHLKGSGWYVTDYGNSAKPGSTPSKNGSQKPEDTKEKVKDTTTTDSTSSTSTSSPAPSSSSSTTNKK